MSGEEKQQEVRNVRAIFISLGRLNNLEIKCEQFSAEVKENLYGVDKNM